MRKPLLLLTALLVCAPATVRAQADPAALGVEGWRALQQDDGDAAAVLFRRALALAPDDAALHLGAGAAAHMLGQDDVAVATLTQALRIDPTLTYASKLLAEIAYLNGDIRQAIEIYSRALDHAPDSGELSLRVQTLNDEARRREAAARFTVTVTGGREDGLAAHATQALTAAYWRMARLIGAYPSDGIAVELDTARPFQHVNTIPSWRQAHFAGRVAIHAGGASGDLDALARVLNHELAHAMIASMAPTGVPSWLHEGFAQLAEPADLVAAERRLKAAGSIAWPSDGPFRANQRLADVSLLIARALVDRIGAQSTVLLDELADGQSLEDALAQFGFSYADLQADVVGRLQ